MDDEQRQRFQRNLGLFESFRRRLGLQEETEYPSRTFLQASGRVLEYPLQTFLEASVTEEFRVDGPRVNAVRRVVNISTRLPFIFQNRRLNQLYRTPISELVRIQRENVLVVPGLTPARIARFEHFDADESMVGKQCLVCLDYLEAGRRMVRLSCHIDHYLCKVCADGWFKDHRTCPTCRHQFN